jgi:hypothetical protein
VTHVERSIEVEVPVRTAYDQWTQFEEFPRFMSGVSEVRQVGEAMTHWVAEIAGVRREWDAAILEQLPDQKVAWAATSGATNAGAVFFTAVGPDRTQVRLTLDYEPEGIVEKIGDVLDVIDRQAVADLDRFKEFIEQAGSATGGWRGRVEDGDVQAGGAGSAAAGGGAAVAAGDVEGAPIAVGPTGDTRGTVATEPGPARTATAFGDEDGGVGHSGDPIAVEPPSSAGTSTGTSGPTAGAARSSAGVAGFGTDTGLRSEDPASGVLTGNPDSGSRAAGTGAFGAGAGTGGPTAGAASSSAGVAGFGTDTGLRSEDPASGVLTGNPDSAGTTSWTDEPGARTGTTEATTDPVGESWSDASSATDESGASSGADTTGGSASRWADEPGEAGGATSDPVGESWSEDAESGGGQAGTTGSTAGAQRSGGVTTGMGGARGPVTPERPTP